jgi:hypothetical protein
VLCAGSGSQLLCSGPGSGRPELLCSRCRRAELLCSGRDGLLWPQPRLQVEEELVQGRLRQVQEQVQEVERLLRSGPELLCSGRCPDLLCSRRRPDVQRSGCRPDLCGSRGCLLQLV